LCLCEDIIPLSCFEVSNSELIREERKLLLTFTSKSFLVHISDRADLAFSLPQIHAKLVPSESPEVSRDAVLSRYGSVEAKANIVRAVLSRDLPVVGNVDGTVAGLLVSYEGFQRLAHDERARANGETRTIAEAARQLECNTSSIRRLVELEWLRARPSPKAFRVTEESIAEFKKRYVSLLSIARTTNSASWALQNTCKRCNLPMLVASQPRKKGSQAFIRAEQRQELLCLRSSRNPKSCSAEIV
jgi:hypothetical protein